MTKNNSKEPLHVRALQWAFDRGSLGFKINELKEAITSNEDEWIWIKRMMLGEIQGEPPLIAHLGTHHTGNGEYLYFVTSSGASTLVSYIELREAKKSSDRAKYIAISSLVIAILGSVAEILVQICF
ncbi:MAG: hypothetical protein WC763_01830 [Candidatus Paceibacterota bacterium]